MRIRLRPFAMLFAVGVLALADAPAFASDANGASDTGARAAVRADARISERWYCTPISCSGGRTSSASAVLGFGVTALAAAWISRRRPAGAA